MHGSEGSTCSSQATTVSIHSVVQGSSQTAVSDEIKASFTSSTRVRTIAGRGRDHLTLSAVASESLWVT